MQDSIDFAKTMIATGIKYLSIHPRTKQEKSIGPAHWVVAKALKEEAKSDINLSGDIFSVKDAHVAKRFTNCDGFLMSRGAIHNPGLFNDIKENWGKYSEEELGTEYRDHFKPITDFPLQKMKEDDPEVNGTITRQKRRNYKERKKLKKIAKQTDMPEDKDNPSEAKVRFS